MINNGLFMSASDEWATPQWLYDKLNAEFHFDLDVCATHENAKHANHYTRQENGLIQNWKGVLLYESALWPANQGVGTKGIRKLS